MSFLKISQVSSFYGSIQALRSVDLTVEKNEIVTLIGSNGAGKSTLLMTICGNPQARYGTVEFEGQNITHMETHKIAYLGIAQSPEGRRIFPKMTVFENLQMGSIVPGLDKFEEDIDSIFELFPILKTRMNQRGGTLSGGEQQMLAIGRALMSRPKLLLLDEPSLGLAPKIVSQIFEIIQEINKTKNTTILLVEQNAKQALKLAHRGYVLVNGEIKMQGTGEELLCNEDVKSAYLYGEC